MTQMRKVLAVTEETTLLPFLLREVTGKSRNTVKGLLTRRQVMVDGTVVTRFDAPLLPGQQVTLLPPEAAGAAARAASRWSPICPECSKLWPKSSISRSFA